MRSGARTTTARSASLLFNNLASCRQYTAYVHYSSAVIVPDSSIASGGGNSAQCAIVKEPDDAQIQQVRWVPLHAGDLVDALWMRADEPLHPLCYPARVQLEHAANPRLAAR